MRIHIRRENLDIVIARIRQLAETKESLHYLAHGPWILEIGNSSLFIILLLIIFLTSLPFSSILKSMITDADIGKLKRVFATKDDILKMETGIRRDMATKDDLLSMEARMDKKFATKDDLNEIKTEMRDTEARMDKKYVSKDDLNRFATKEDLNELKSEMSAMEKRIRRDMPTRNELRLEISSLHAELQEVKNEIIETITGEILKIYGHMGEQDKHIDDIRATQRGHHITIGDHEKRLTRIETTHST